MGKLKSIDGERYRQRYTSRNPNSVWSLANKKRAEKMIKQGLMTRSGLVKIEAAKKTGKWQAAYSSRTKPKLPQDLKKALEKNAKAGKNFGNLTNSQQFQYIYWILAGKTDETRKKRVEKVVKRAAINKKPGTI